MAACINPECRNGRTPGVVGSGRGSTKAPLVGAVMRWGWVNCRACSPSEQDTKHGLKYIHKDRTPEEIAERARLADSRAEYKAEQVTTPLQRIRLKSDQNQSTSLNGLTQAAPSPPDNTRLDKMLDQITKLSEQVSELLTENRVLRAKLEGYPPSYGDLPADLPTKKSRVKKALAAKSKPS